MYVDKYNREKAYQYAEEWALKRNPKYYNFDKIGGDCTNFISQCIYAGSNVMNYQNTFGWYYNTANDKSPSWTGVEYLYNFLINNKGIGPFGESAKEIEIGDVIQLSFDGMKFAHSLIVVENINSKIYVASHTFDSYNRNIDSYVYKDIRYIHLKGVRKY